MDFRKSIAAAALVTAALATPSASAFVRYEPTNPIVQPVRYHQWDRNKDGVVTRSEWRSSQTAFTRHDRNHDGVITAADRNIAPPDNEKNIANHAAARARVGRR